MNANAVIAAYKALLARANDELAMAQARVQMLTEANETLQVELAKAKAPKKKPAAKKAKPRSRARK